MCTSRPPTLSSTDSTDIELATNKDLEQQPHARQRGDIELATNRDLEPHARQGVAERAPMQSQLRQLLALALPIMLSCMLSFLMPVVDLLFVGHLGTHELAAAALGDTVFKTVALPLQGFASALDTFLSQSYGAGRLDAYGRWAHVGTLVMLGLSVPCMLFLGLSEQLLLAIGQEATLAASAGGFCWRLVPGMPPFVAFLTLTKYLQAQSILAPSVAIALVANLLNAAFNWLLIFKLELGFAGAPLATTASRWAQLLLLLGYLAAARRRLAGTLPSLVRVECLGSACAYRTCVSACAAGWAARAAPLCKLGAPGALMLALEAWAFDFSTLLAGYLGKTALDAHVVLLTVISFTFVSFPLAVGIAASIRVGQSLGAADASAARAAARWTVALCGGFMTALAIVKLCVRRYLGRLFTDDEAVIALVAELVFIAALFQISDGVQAACAGVMRGMGRQRLVAGLNLLGFWVIGLPLGALLTFGPTHIGVVGLWWGLAAGLTVVAAFGVTVLLRTDWDAEARSTAARLGTPEASKGSVPVVETEPPAECPADNVRRAHLVE